MVETQVVQVITEFNKCTNFFMNYFEGVIRVELQVPERMITKMEITKMFEYMTQVSSES